MVEVPLPERRAVEGTAGAVVVPTQVEPRGADGG
jgi:hypothetical protein